MLGNTAVGVEQITARPLMSIQHAMLAVDAAMKEITYIQRPRRNSVASA